MADAVACCCCPPDSQPWPLCCRLLTEVKRLDDKLLLVDIHLLESRGERVMCSSHSASLVLLSAGHSCYVVGYLRTETALFVLLTKVLPFSCSAPRTAQRPQGQGSVDSGEDSSECDLRAAAAAGRGEHTLPTA